jgi:hypothetical protein
MDPYNSYDSTEAPRPERTSATVPSPRRATVDVDARIRLVGKVVTALLLLHASIALVTGTLEIPMRHGRDIELHGTSIGIMWAAHAALFGAAWLPRERRPRGIPRFFVLLGAWLVLSTIAMTTADTLSPPRPRAQTPEEARTRAVLQEADLAREQGDAALQAAQAIEHERARR